MALKFIPYQGQILICNYEVKALGAEMVKARPSIVISPRLRTRHGLSTIVPLSTTPPDKQEAWHHFLKLDRPLPKPFSSPEMWVKCDMIATVSFERLSPISAGRDQYGKRKYAFEIVNKDDFLHIQKCIKAALGFI
jgi:uncharacterized protein YifN (PemK superfamily)